MASYHLSSQAVDSFWRDGFYTPLTIFTEAETLEFRREFESLDERFGSREARRYITDLHLIASWAWDAVHDPRIVEPVSDLLGPNVLLWSLNWFIKEPHDQKFVTFHQDATYWGLEPHDVVTAWVALSDASQTTGPMRFVPGSHLSKVYEHEDSFGEGNLLSRGQVISKDIDQEQAILAPLSVGQMSLHHVKTIHGSEPNQTDDRRIGMVLRYCATHVKQTKIQDTAVLVCGSDRFGNFELLPKPAVDYGEQELERQKSAVGRMHRALHSKDCEEN